MKKSRILIISEHALFADAITHTLKEEGISVAATVKDIDAALPFIQKQRPDIIIVDYSAGFTPDARMFSSSDGDNKDRRVIFLTLDGNKMVVHHRQQMKDATPADLISVLRANTNSTASMLEAS
jgi:DNA-binding NarL/FixJ family response regulator